MHLHRPRHLKAKIRKHPRRVLVIASLLLLGLVGGTALNQDPPAQAAINLSSTREHSTRLKVNRYAEIQVAQRAPYRYGSTGPVSFDCSGLVFAAYRWAGVPLPVRSSRQMAYWTRPTSLRYARTGDLLFYSYNGRLSGVYHVMMFYRKNGTGPRMSVAASYTGGPPVKFYSIRTSHLVKVGKAIY